VPAIRVATALLAALLAVGPLLGRAQTSPEAVRTTDPTRPEPTSIATDVLAAPGFTGGTLTPTARTLPHGTMGLRYDRQVPGARVTSGHNYTVGFGLLPYVEAVGRIAANDLNCNLYKPGDCALPNGLRDLSMSFKVAVPIDPQERFSIGLGATDLGGAATNFRSYYGVAGWRQGPFEASLGYGKTDQAGGLLGGLFGRLSVRVLPSLQLSAERIPDGVWTSARLLAPVGWVPDRWQAYADLNRRIGDGTVAGQSWVSIGVGIPLDVRGTGQTAEAQRRAALAAPTPLWSGAPLPWSTPAAASGAGAQAAGVPIVGATPSAATAAAAVSSASPAVAARTPVPSPAAAVAVAPQAAPLPSIPSAVMAAASNAPLASGERPGRADAAALARVARVLSDAGVDDVAVGEQDRADGAVTVVVRADNGAWRWTDLDAMGVVLSRVARVLAPIDAPVRVVIGRRGVPTLAVEGSARCIEAFLRSATAQCPVGVPPRLLASGEAGFDAGLRDVRWAHRGGNASWGRLRVTVAPGLRTGVATEYGVFDYSLAAEVGVEVPLWTGASIEARHSFPISNSQDFEDGRVFGADRHRSITDRVLIQQTVGLGYGVSARAAYGRIFDDWRGGLGEARWQPGDGTHRVSAMIGRFENDGSLRKGFTAEPALATYRYLIAPLDWAIEVTAGRFFLNDTGWSVLSRHWFGDVAVSAYLRSTTHPGLPEPERFAGVSIEIPLTPRRSLDTRWFQLQGADRWSYGIETLVGRAHNRLTAGHGILPPVPSGLDWVHDSDRAVGAMARRHWDRIRDAAKLTPEP